MLIHQVTEYAKIVLKHKLHNLSFVLFILWNVAVSYDPVVLDHLLTNI